jgi:hypothetical protein
MGNRAVLGDANGRGFVSPKIYRRACCFRRATCLGTLLGPRRWWPVGPAELALRPDRSKRVEANIHRFYHPPSLCKSDANGNPTDFDMSSSARVEKRGPNCAGRSGASAPHLPFPYFFLRTAAVVVRDTAVSQGNRPNRPEGLPAADGADGGGPGRSADCRAPHAAARLVAAAYFACRSRHGAAVR